MIVSGVPSILSYQAGAGFSWNQLCSFSLPEGVKEVRIIGGKINFTGVNFPSIRLRKSGGECIIGKRINENEFLFTSEAVVTQKDKIIIEVGMKEDDLRFFKVPSIRFRRNGQGYFLEISLFAMR